MSKDLVPSDGYNPGKGQFLVYEAEDGQVKIDVRLADETVWLTQQLMADLFQTTKQNIGQHLKNIFSEGELLEDSVVKKFFTTAAEIVHERADDDKTNMGLTSWRGAKVRKQDVTIAKNYLTEKELLALNNLVEQYLIFAEGQAMRRIPMQMADWIKKLDAFMAVNECEILTHAGRISHEMAREMAEAEYEKFNQRRIRQKDCLDGDFEKTIKQLTKGERGRKA